MIPDPTPITFAEFRTRAVEEFACECTTRPVCHPVTLKPVNLTHLARSGRSGEMCHVWFEMHDDDVMSPEILRSNCYSLDIDPRKFGIVDD